MRIRASTWVSLVILLFIPASWVVQYILNRMMLDALMSQFGDKVLDHLPELNILFLSSVLVDTSLTYFPSEVTPVPCMSTSPMNAYENCLSSPVGEYK